MENNYYVYAYLDPRKYGRFSYDGLEFSFLYEPFYIGKGKNKQMYSHLREKVTNTENRFKFRKINKIKELGYEPIIITLLVNLTEENAFNLEKEFIKIIGRRCNDKSAPLTNIAIGGSAPPKFYDLPINKQKEIRKKFSDKTYSKETIEKRTKHLIGKKRPQHIIDNLKKRVDSSNPMFGKFRFKVLQYTLDNVFIKEWKGITEAIKELNLPKSANSKIYEVCFNKRKSAYGFIWKNL